MTLDRPLVLATKNNGKISEFRDLFRKSGIEIKTLDDFGPIPPVIEDGATFEDNAVKKAQFTARVLGIPAIADDSGLTVKALQGAPGGTGLRHRLLLPRHLHRRDRGISRAAEVSGHPVPAAVLNAPASRQDVFHRQRQSSGSRRALLRVERKLLPQAYLPRRAARTRHYQELGAASLCPFQPLFKLT